MNAFPASGAKNPKKQEYFGRLERLARTRSNILIVEADNVGSKQLADIRFALRGKAQILMGKNTMINTCLKNNVIGDKPQVEKLVELVKGNVGLVFCEIEPAEVKKIIASFKVPAAARQGLVAPNDVFISAGPTGMDPGQTSFFQSLGIATKIVKGQIEIQSDVHIIKTGEKVNASQAILLTKLDIRPFSYGLTVTTVYDDGVVYPASVLDITTQDIEDEIKAAVASVTALALGVGMPTETSVPHMLRAAFREVATLALGANFMFPEVEAFKAGMSAAPVANAVASAPAGTVAAAPAEESESDDDMGFSLFD